MHNPQNKQNDFFLTLMVPTMSKADAITFATLVVKYTHKLMITAVRSKHQRTNDVK